MLSGVLVESQYFRKYKKKISVCKNNLLINYTITLTNLKFNYFSVQDFDS